MISLNDMASSAIVINDRNICSLVHIGVCYGTRIVFMKSCSRPYLKGLSEWKSLKGEINFSEYYSYRILPAQAPSCG